MGRGFLSGLFWGGILSLVALFISNQTLDRQTLSFPKPEATAVDVPGGSEFNQARPESEPVLPAVDARPEDTSVVGVAAPDQDDTTPPTLDVTALEVPVPETTQTAPEALGDAPEIEAETTEPDFTAEESVDTPVAEPLVEPETPGQAPETEVVDVDVPEVGADAEDAPEVKVAEDAAPQVEPVEEERAPLIIIHGSDEANDETEIAALPESEAPDVQTEPDTAPQVVGQIEAPEEPSVLDQSDAPSLPWLDQLRNSQIDEAPNAPSAPSVAEEPSLPPVGTNTPAPPVIAGAGDTAADSVDSDAVAAAVDAALSDTPSSDSSPEAPSEAEEAIDIAEDDGSILQPVETFTDRDDAQTGTGNLPVVRRLGDSSSVEEEPSESAALGDTDAAEVDTSVDEPVADGPALEIFATEFDAEGDLPLMSIVLVHEGGEPLPLDLLEILPPNIAFAVNASLSEAAGIAQAYRSVGREVVMIPSLPEGAAPQDVEQALGANFELVPEAVAVMDVSGSSFQSDRAAIEQVVDVVSSSGHGIITFPRGLNPAHQAAQRAGVPTGLIFRNLDGASETQEQIRRSLDRAAFRARQDEAVILVGTTGSTMLSALSDWVLGNRAASVTLAPISAALGG